MTWKLGSVVDYDGTTLQFVRMPAEDFIRIDVGDGANSLFLPVSILEEVLATQFELDSLERAARYAGVTP